MEVMISLQFVSMSKDGEAFNPPMGQLLNKVLPHLIKARGDIEGESICL